MGKVLKRDGVKRPTIYLGDSERVEEDDSLRLEQLFARHIAPPKIGAKQGCDTVLVYASFTRSSNLPTIAPMLASRVSVVWFAGAFSVVLDDWLPQGLGHGWRALSARPVLILAFMLLTASEISILRELGRCFLDASAKILW